MSANENDTSSYVNKCTRWGILPVVVAILVVIELLQTDYEIHIDKTAHALPAGPIYAVGDLEPALWNNLSWFNATRKYPSKAWLDERHRIYTKDRIYHRDKTPILTAIPTPEATNVPVPVPSPIPTFSECPLTDDFDHDYIIEIFTEVFDKLNRGWFGFGGFVLNLLRVGSIKLKIGNMEYSDNDIDVAIVVNDSDDRTAMYKDIQNLCKNRKHLKCVLNPHGWCSQIYISALKFHFTISWAMIQVNDYVLLGLSKKKYTVPMSSIFPMKRAKFYHTSIPVPSQFMRIFSNYHASKWHAKKRDLTVPSMVKAAYIWRTQPHF